MKKGKKVTTSNKKRGLQRPLSFNIMCMDGYLSIFASFAFLKQPERFEKAIILSKSSISDPIIELLLFSPATLSITRAFVRSSPNIRTCSTRMSRKIAIITSTRFPLGPLKGIKTLSYVIRTNPRSSSFQCFIASTSIFNNLARTRP